MTGFARRAAAGLLAAVFGISMLAGCTPNNAAVGDTQSAGDAVAHSIKDRNSLDVAMIGSQDEQTDRLTLDAMEAGGLRPVYLPVAGTVDMQDTPGKRSRIWRNAWSASSSFRESTCPA